MHMSVTVKCKTLACQLMGHEDVITSAALIQHQSQIDVILLFFFVILFFVIAFYDISQYMILENL